MNLPEINEAGVAAVNPTFAEMQAMAELTRPEERASGNRLPALKINYDSDSKHPLGVWVLDQVKDAEGNITNEGDIVTDIVILSAHRRLQFYNKKNPSKSPVSELVAPKGRPKDSDAFNAKVDELNASGIEGKGKWQFIVCAMASVGGELKNCVMRISSYHARVALESYLETMVVWTDEASGQRLEVPYFTFVTHLCDTVKDKNGTTVFWKPTFERGRQMTSQAHKDFFEKQRLSAYDYIDMQNSYQAGEAAATPAPTPAAAPDQQWQPPAGTEDDVPFNEPAQAEFVPDVPAGAKQVVHGANKETEAPVAEEYDIEAAINGALAANG